MRHVQRIKEFAIGVSLVLIPIQAIAWPSTIEWDEPNTIPLDHSTLYYSISDGTTTTEEQKVSIPATGGHAKATLDLPDYTTCNRNAVLTLSVSVTSKGGEESERSYTISQPFGAMQPSCRMPIPPTGVLSNDVPAESVPTP